MECVLEHCHDGDTENHRAGSLALTSIASSSFLLALWGIPGDHDVCSDAAQPCRQGDCGRMVAAAVRDNAFLCNGR